MDHDENRELRTISVSLLVKMIHQTDRDPTRERISSLEDRQYPSTIVINDIINEGQKSI
jgi:hypothetical protein